MSRFYTDISNTTPLTQNLIVEDYIYNLPALVPGRNGYVYDPPSITVNEEGRILTIGKTEKNYTDFSVTADTGDSQSINDGDTLKIVGTNNIKTRTNDPDTVQIDLADTHVTPGAYTFTNLTVDPQGRITAASSGAPPAGSTGGNPTSQIGTTVVNGTANTFMRSDACPTLADSVVTKAKLAADSVATDKIIDNAVTTQKIVNDAVTTEKLQSTAVTTGKIANQAVTHLQLADDSISSVKIRDNAVTTDKILDGNITTTKLAGPIDSTENQILIYDVNNSGWTTRPLVANEGLEFNDGSLGIKNECVTIDKLAPNSVSNNAIGVNKINPNKLEGPISTGLFPDLLVYKNHEWKSSRFRFFWEPNGGLLEETEVDENGDRLSTDLATNSIIINDFESNDEASSALKIKGVNIPESSTYQPSSERSALYVESGTTTLHSNTLQSTLTLINDKTDNSGEGNKAAALDLRNNPIKFTDAKYFLPSVSASSSNSTDPYLNKVLKIQDVKFDQDTDTGNQIPNFYMDFSNLDEVVAGLSGLATNDGLTHAVTDGVATVGITSIHGSKLENNTVTDLKLLDKTVSSGKIADLAVGEEHIKNLAVKNQHLSFLSVGSDQIAAHAVTNGKLGISAVHTANILNRNVTAEKLSLTGVDPDTFTNATITVDSTGRLTAASSGSASITSLTIGTDTGDDSNLGDGHKVEIVGGTGVSTSITSDDTNTTITIDVDNSGTEVLSGLVTTDGLSSSVTDNIATVGISSIDGAKITDSTVSGAKLVDETVSASKIAADAVVESRIADGAVTESKLQDVGTAGTYESATITVDSKGRVTSASSGGGIGTCSCTHIETLAFPANRDQVYFSSDMGPVKYHWMQTAGRNVVFNRARIHVTEAWSNTPYVMYMQIYKLGATAVLGDVASYGDSEKIAWTDSIPLQLPIGMKTFTWNTSTETGATIALETGCEYFCACWGNWGHLLGHKDAGDDKYGLQGYFFEGDGDLNNVADFNARTSMHNSYDTSSSADSAFWIEWYYQI